MLLQKRFEDAVQRASVNYESYPATTDELLELFGIHQQAEVGDNNTDIASHTELEDRAKWHAWNNWKGTDSDEAKEEFIRRIEEIEARASA